MMKHSIPSVFSDSICDSSRDNGDIVIVGNGIAGITAALEVCRLSPEKHVVVITEQNHPTIYTPALKQFAIGKLAREQLLAHPAGTERANHIHMINARVEEIKAHRKCVYLSNGRTFGYGSLLLATGSSPAGLAPTLPGHDFDGVLTLHRLHDYLDLRRRLHEVKEAVVIGGGIHAIETVMSLHNRHIRVHWLIRSEAFCPHMLDCEASDMVLEDCRRAGVSVRTGVEIVGIVGRVGAVAGVVTSDEQFLPCQLVIACTGSRPVTTLATYCDVPLEQLNGILVDDHLRTSAENIFAAGDCTALENPQTGAYQSRMQWHAAALQGRIAAAMMTGHTDSVSSMGVPWHTTQVGSLPMLSVGNPLNIPGATFLTDRNKRSYRRLAFYDNRLIGYLALGGRLPDSFAIKRLIDEGHSVRGIEKDLLIGEFDEHRYFSQPKPQTIHPKVHTEELPTFQLPLVPKVSHTTEPLMPAIDISSRRKVIKKPDESVDDVCLQKESGEIKYKFSEIIANKDKRGVYSHAREIARLGQNERTMLLEEIEDTFGDSFPLHKYMRLLEREREHYESSISSATNVRSVKALMGGQSTPSRWLINDMLPEGLYLVSDTQKIGISWFNVALGLTISGSAPVLGSNMRMRHGNVFYLSLEENEDQLHERLMNFLVSGVSLAEDFEYATTWPRLHPDGVTALEEWLHMHPRARLIIIDSWKKIKPVVTTKTGDTAQTAEYEALIGLKYLVDTYNIGILLYPRSARTPSAKTSSEPYGVTGVASCADGFLTLKQGKDQSEALLSAIWKPSRKGVHHSAEFRRDAWQSVKEPIEIGSRLPESQQPLLVAAH